MLQYFLRKFSWSPLTVPPSAPPPKAWGNVPPPARYAPVYNVQYIVQCSTVYMHFAISHYVLNTCSLNSIDTSIRMVLNLGGHRYTFIRNSQQTGAGTCPSWSLCVDAHARGIYYCHPTNTSTVHIYSIYNWL